MTHYLIELAIWILIAFFIGCLVGWFLRNAFGASKPVRESEPAAVPEPPSAPPARLTEPAPPPATVAVPEPPAPPEVPTEAEPAVAAAPLPLTGRMERPRGLSEPRDGKADDLQRLSGIGPKNEKILHNLGVFHFDQIAAWTADHVAWVDDHLKFNGRIGRERWIEQASLLATGKEDEFREQFGTGGLKNQSGITESGSRTRRS